MNKHNTQSAHVLSVNMGYGHARAAYALRDLGEIVSANDYKGIPTKDRELWKKSREIYETISRLKPVPLVGDFVFNIMDEFQEIPEFYPRRDLSKPSLQLRQIYRMIEKQEWGKHLIEQLRKNPIPLITTFFTTAFMADVHGYPGEIYCVTTDADIARHWAPLDPKKSSIKYIAANGRCKERLMLYGVKEKNIYLTGFPLPKELVGGYPDTQLREDLMQRLCQLDPKGIFHARYDKTLKAHFGKTFCQSKPNRKLTTTFSVGGAGAQKRIAVDMMKSLKRRLLKGDIRLALFPGIRKPVANYFKEHAIKLGLKRCLDKNLLIPVYPDRPTYFTAFSSFLRETDLLLTKPSEMSFYTGVGLPVIMAPPIGSQEKFNRVWLQYVGGGVPMMNPKYINEWLFDWIGSGGLARMAWSGYIEAPTHGTYRIEDVVLGRKSEIHPLPHIV